MNESPGLRTQPPSGQANNQDIFVWALYVLGGADRDVDVEDIYLKSFEMAPARLGWRTRPEIPDYKKTSKALQSIEDKTHVGLIHRPHKYSRRLTSAGVCWVEDYKELLENLYSKSNVEASLATNVYERARHEIKTSSVWQQFLLSPSSIVLVEVAPVLKCSAASPRSVWSGRINELRRAADVLKDADLHAFANAVEAKVTNGR